MAHVPPTQMAADLVKEILDHFHVVGSDKPLMVNVPIDKLSEKGGLSYTGSAALQKVCDLVSECRMYAFIDFDCETDQRLKVFFHPDNAEGEITFDYKKNLEKVEWKILDLYRPTGERHRSKPVWTRGVR